MIPRQRRPWYRRTGEPAPGEETPEPRPPHCPKGGDSASEVWLVLAVAGLFVLALCTLTAVAVTALRSF